MSGEERAVIRVARLIASCAEAAHQNGGQVAMAEWDLIEKLRDLDNATPDPKAEIAERVVYAARTLVESDPVLCDHVTPIHEWEKQMDMLHDLKALLAEWRSK